MSIRSFSTATSHSISSLLSHTHTQIFYYPHIDILPNVHVQTNERKGSFDISEDFHLMESHWYIETMLKNKHHQKMQDDQPPVPVVVKHISNLFDAKHKRETNFLFN